MKRLISALVILVPCLASAHDLWIEPSTFRPAAGVPVTVALRVGQKLQGEALPRIPTLIDRFLIRGKGGEAPVVGRAGADPAGVTRVPDAGQHWIGYQSHPYPMTVSAQKFEDYLKEEGLEPIVAMRARKGQSTSAGRERFSRCAKSLLQSPDQGASSSGVFDTPIGFTLELVPGKNPYTLRKGDDLPLSLLFRGKPLANILVVGMSREDPENPVHARTDRRGQVALRLGHGGFWLIKAVHMEAAPPDSGVDWESWWASMTFALAGSGK